MYDLLLRACTQFYSASAIVFSFWVNPMSVRLLLDTDRDCNKATTTTTTIEDDFHHYASSVCVSLDVCMIAFPLSALHRAGNATMCVVVR